MNPSHRPAPATHSPATELSSWLPVLEARANAALRLIVFPYAGGGTPVFRPWLELLPRTIELRVVQLPGRGPRFREERFHRVQSAIDALEPHLVRLLDRPFAFFGHSLGTVLAFEMARRLRERGLAPVQLFVSGRIAPHVPSPFPPIHQFPDAIFLENVKKLNGMTQAVLDSKELLEIVLPIIRSDFTLLETYRFDGSPPSVSCPIMAFGGDQDPQTNPAGLNAWRDQTTGRFELRMLRGDHFFVDTARAELIKLVVDKLGETGLVHTGGSAGG